MHRIFIILTIFSLSFSFAPAFAENEVPAEPLNQSPPQFPEKCIPGAEEQQKEETVAVAYGVTRDGVAENVRVRESSDSCFDDAAIAAVRGWRFRPRRVDGRDKPQTDMETTFRFVWEGKTTVNTFDARPIKRIQEPYPENCIDRAADEEAVVVQFDVLENGSTANIEIIESTDSCFNRTVRRSVEQWRYAPAIIDGKPAARRGVQTRLVYAIAGPGSDAATRMRRTFVRKLNKAGKLVQSDPQKCLDMLEQIEAQYGDSFSPAESAAFHQVRGFARLGVGDAAGSLDDLRIAQKRAASPEAQETIAVTIISLEAYLAKQAAAKGDEESDPGADSTDSAADPN